MKFNLVKLRNLFLNVKLYHAEMIKSETRNTHLGKLGISGTSYHQLRPLIIFHYLVTYEHSTRLCGVDFLITVYGMKIVDDTNKLSVKGCLNLEDVKLISFTIITAYSCFGITESSSTTVDNLYNDSCSHVNFYCSRKQRF